MIVIMQLEQVLQVLFVCCSYSHQKLSDLLTNSVNLNFIKHSNKMISQIENPHNIYGIQSPVMDLKNKSPL